MDKKTTIYDVAREANVSLATVSRVINGSNVVKKATKDRVLEVIDRLDFKPNEIARGLAKSKTTTISVVFPQKLFSHIEEMISGIGDASRTLKYNVNFHTTDIISEDNVTDELVEKIVKSRADGVILFNNELLDEQIQCISKYNIPIVVVGKTVIGEKIGSIDTNISELVLDTVKKHIENQSKKILFVTSKQNLIDEIKLVDQIKKIGMDHVTFVESSTDYESCYQQLDNELKQNNYQLVITTSDIQAVVINNIAKEHGVKVPSDMEIIGMLDTTYAKVSVPQLTSIYIPIYDMGALAIRLLTKMLQLEEIENSHISIKGQFIYRNSTK